MNRGPHGIPEEVLVEFITVVALATVVVAFAAYVGTWISAWRHQRKAATGMQPPSTARPAAAPGPIRRAREGAGTLQP